MTGGVGFLLKKKFLKKLFLKKSSLTANPEKTNRRDKQKSDNFKDYKDKWKIIRTGS